MQAIRRKHDLDANSYHELVSDLKKTKEIFIGVDADRERKRVRCHSLFEKAKDELSSNYQKNY